MRLSASARRALRIAVATAVVGTSAVVLAAPAQAAPAKIERVGYTCTATNTTIDISLDGPQQFYVTAETDLPESVQPGETVPATDTTLRLFLPPKLVNRLMGPMKVTKVKGGSSTNVDLQAVAPGGDVIATVNQQVKGPGGEKGPLVKDWVNLVKDQEVTIVAQGKVGAVPVPDAPEGNGLIYVQMPKRFVLHSEMDPPVINQIDKADLECVRDKDTADARVIGTIGIGAGCSESDCPLPAAATGPGTTPDEGGSGDGSGTDPEVIDPVDPDDENDVSDSGYDWDDDSDGSSDVKGVSDTTTELPATGSPFAAGLAGLFGVLLAVRLALAVRTRRTGA